MTEPTQLAVRVKNARYDGLLDGYLHDAPKVTKTDPGGFRSASFAVDQRLGYRSDMIQPYSRIYIYNKRNGNTVFEGDIGHPSRSVTQEGPLFEVRVDGPVERLNDWSGSRIYVDRDLQAWIKTATANTATTVEAVEDRGGSGLDSLTLAFPTETHVDLNSRAEAGYYRIREAGQTIGRFDYTDDGGHTSGSPGWQVRTIITPPSTVARTQTLDIGGHTSSPQNVTGNDWDTAYVQLIWTSGSSNTGTADNVWVSIRGLVVVVRTKLKDGTDKTTGYVNAVTADQVWEDMLGSELLSNAFDGPNATVDLGTSAFIYQLAYPDGVTPLQIADDLMTYEPGCTYLTGPSNPVNGKYSLKWISRPNSVRYEAMVWTDEYVGGTQDVDQYNEVAARWKTPIGNIRMTVATQSIPEMDAAGRKRRYFHDLGTVLGDATNVTTANNAVLQDHRYPKNGGRLTISRPIVDLFTGRRVEPCEIEPGYMIRLAGVAPSPDSINASQPNGSTVCRIVTTDYDGGSNSVALDLDAVPYSMARAIRNAKPRPLPPRFLRRPEIQR